ncbi:MAG: hypothetical protein DRK00_09260 [Thermoprotei archaeon]|nr:MAG: hypothetical protein DRK00_09260 [Thermoprotei archaeon]
MGSSGRLDFHLKKLEDLITVGGDGRYRLTRGGYAALQATEVIKRYGWQRRAYILNLATYVVVNAYAALNHFSLRIWILLPISTAWLVFYTYWTKRRGAPT